MRERREEERERVREREQKQRAREGGAREGGRVDYIEKTSILALFYTFVESFILIL